MRKIGLLLATGMLLAATPVTAYAEWYRTGNYTHPDVEIPDVISGTDDGKIVDGLRKWGLVLDDEDDELASQSIRVKTVYIFPDGGFTARVNRDGEDHTVSVDSGGNPMQTVREVVSVGSSLEGTWRGTLIKLALTEWSKQFGHAGDITVKSVTDSMVSAQVGGSVRQMSIGVGITSSENAVNLPVWFSPVCGEDGTKAECLDVFATYKAEIAGISDGLITVNQCDIGEGGVFTILAESNAEEMKYTRSNYGSYYITLPKSQEERNNLVAVLGAMFGDDSIDFSVNGKLPGRD